MRYFRLLFLSGILSVAACSSPTEPRLPQPDPDDKERPPTHGLYEPVDPAVPLNFA